MNLPQAVPDSLFFRKYYLDELNKFFSIKGRIEKRKMPCLAIVRKGSRTDELLLSKGDGRRRNVYLNGHDILQKVYGTPFNYVIETLKTYPDTPPIVNKTGYSNEIVDMELNLKWEFDDAWNKPLDVEALRKSLNKYDLDIIEAPDTETEVLVITENAGG